MLRTILAAVDIKKRDDVIANISTLDPQKVEKITLLHVIDERFGKRNISEDEKQVAKRVFLEPPDRSTESHWRAEIRAGGAGPRAIEANTNIKSHLS